MIHAINFATDGSGGTKNLTDRRKWQNDKLREFSSIGTITSFIPDDIPAVFKSVYSGILSTPRGAGYWWWKPYFILRKLNEIPVGDYVIYVDADLAINGDPNDVVHETDYNQGISVIDNATSSYKYTKRDCFIMMGVDTEEYHNSPQSWAAIVAVKHNPFSVNFITEWLMCCCNKHLIDDSPSVMGDELSGFEQHRWDQSILSILLKKSGITMLPNSRDSIFAHPPW